MKLKLAAMFVIASLGLTSNVALASKSDRAYTACKQHVSELHNGQANTKLKKIRKRKGNIEVTVKVRANGDAFSVKCLVDREGALSYTSNQDEKVIARN